MEYSVQVMGFCPETPHQLRFDAGSVPGLEQLPLKIIAPKHFQMVDELQVAIVALPVILDVVLGAADGVEKFENAIQVGIEISR